MNCPENGQIIPALESILALMIGTMEPLILVGMLIDPLAGASPLMSPL